MCFESYPDHKSTTDYPGILWLYVFEKAVTWDVFTDHAPCSAERPDSDGVWNGGERDTDDDEEKISDCEADDERVGRAVHLQVGHNDDDDRQVSDEAEYGDDREQDGHDHAHHLLLRQHPRHDVIDHPRCRRAVQQPLGAGATPRRRRCGRHIGHSLIHAPSAETDRQLCGRYNYDSTSIRWMFDARSTVY